MDAEPLRPSSPEEKRSARFSASKKIDQARARDQGRSPQAQLARPQRVDTCLNEVLADGRDVLLELVGSRKEILISLGPPLQRDIDPNLLMLYDISLPSLCIVVGKPHQARCRR